MKYENYKLELYTPLGGYRGPLIVDSLNVSLKISDISHISFNLPEYIDGELNTTMFEVLDNYMVKLEYGAAEKPEVCWFTIYSNPMLFNDAGYTYSYNGFSTEYLLEKQIIKEWSGVGRETYYRYHNVKLGAAISSYPENGILKIELNKPDDMDSIELYEVRESMNDVDNSGSIRNHTMLINSYKTDVAALNNNEYILVEEGGKLYANLKVRQNDTKDDWDPSIKLLTNYKIQIYDNPKNESVYITYSGELRRYTLETEIDKIDTGKVVNLAGREYFTEEYHTKDGVTIQEVWDSWPKIEWKLDISETVEKYFRSNLDFNNISRYQALKNLVKSFDAELYADTNLKTFFIYKEGEFGRNNGLTVSYGSYLKSINRELDASGIITSISGIGKDGLNISMVSPNGSDWEDYSYYLDEFNINDSAFNIQELNMNGIVPLDEVSFNQLKSRWISTTLARKIKKWQVARNYIHKLMSGLVQPISPLTDKHFDLYKKRKDVIDRVTKDERKYQEAYGNMFLYKVLRDDAYNKKLEEPGDAELVSRYNKYNETYETYKKEHDRLLEILNNGKAGIYEAEANGIMKDFLDAAKLLQKDQWFSDEEIEIINTNLKKEYVLQDTAYDDDVTLMNAAIEHINEYKFPKITLTIDIIDILAAHEAEMDHDKIKVGEKINIFFDQFAVDVEAQIKEINIDFDSNAIDLTISTIRNYNKPFANRLVSVIRKLGDNNKNILEFNNDKNKQSFNETEDFYKMISEGLQSKNTNISSGIDGEGGSSVVIDGEGISGYGIDVDDATETVTIRKDDSSRIILNGGAVRVENSNRKIEMSVADGFSISKKLINPNNQEYYQKQFWVDVNGNIRFTGNIIQGVIDDGIGFDDLLAYDAEIIGGTVSIEYEAVKDDDGNITYQKPIPEISSPFLGAAKINQKPWPSNVKYTWKGFGNFEGNITGTSSSVPPFTPIIKDPAVEGETYVELTIEFLNADGTVLHTERRVSAPIVLKNGIDGKDGEKGEKGEKGEEGKKGEDGDIGPGIVFRGSWVPDVSKVYYFNKQRVDVVLYNSSYYVTINSQIGDYVSGTTPPTNTTYWQPFGAQFSSVATDFLLAQKVYVDQVMNVGQKDGSPIIAVNGDTTNPFISIGQDPQGYNKNGIFLGYDGGDAVFSIRRGSEEDESYLKWKNGLEIKTKNFMLDSGGNVTATSGRIGGWKIENKKLSNGGNYLSVDPNYYAIQIGEKFTVNQNGEVNAKSIHISEADSATRSSVSISNGKLSATNADITGAITADSLAVRELVFSQGARIKYDESQTNNQQNVEVKIELLNMEIQGTNDYINYRIYLADAKVSFDDINVTSTWQYRDGFNWGFSTKNLTGTLPAGRNSINIRSYFSSPSHPTEVSVRSYNPIFLTQYQTGSPTGEKNLIFNSNLTPETDNLRNLGIGSRRWKSIYATNSTIITSDRKEKENIDYLIDYSSLFDSLRPVSYNFKNQKNIKSLGLIAQDVQESIDKLGIVDNLSLINKELKDPAKPATDENTSYGIRYSELHALEIYEIQQLKKQVQNLQVIIFSLQDKIKN